VDGLVATALRTADSQYCAIASCAPAGADGLEAAELGLTGPQEVVRLEC